MAFQQFETVQKLSKDNVDAALKAFGAVSKGVQTVAAEIGDYSKKSFETGTATIEKLVAVKSLDKAFEVQGEYLKASYEAAVAQATKLGEIYASVAKEAYKPYESLFAKAAPVATK